MARRILRDDQWKRIEQMLPGKSGDPGRTGEDNQLFVEAVLWVARTGSPWRDLPEAYVCWNSVYQRVARWSKTGVWHRVFAALARDADFEEIFLDSTIVRAHQQAAGAAKKRGAGPRPLARRIDHQDSRGGRRLGAIGALDLDGWSHARYHASPDIDGGHCDTSCRGGQGVRCRSSDRIHHAEGCDGGDSTAAEPTTAALF